MALHVMEKYFTSRVNTMKKTFKEDTALLKRMRRTGGAPNSGYGLDASKESFIRDLEEKEERKRRQDEVCVHDHVNHLLVVYIHPPSHTQAAEIFLENMWEQLRQLSHNNVVTVQHFRLWKRLTDFRPRFKINDVSLCKIFNQ